MATALAEPQKERLVYIANVAQLSFKFYRPHHPGASRQHDDQVAAANYAEAVRYRTHVTALEQLSSELYEYKLVTWFYEYPEMGTWSKNIKGLDSKVEGWLENSGRGTGIVKRLWEDTQGRSRTVAR
ncbi:MAG: hypothetical protein Q9213_005428 [Squamulea squamosa]